MSPILRQLDLANLLTLSSLFLSFYGVKLAIGQHFAIAIICLILTGLIDLFDGPLAKRLERTELQANAGPQLDSLIDLCAFGLAPTLFAYCFGLQDWLSTVVLILFLTANALRLAYFNQVGLTATGDNAYYTGLPVTYVALVIPVVFLLNFIPVNLPVHWILTGTYLLLAIAMISDFKMVKIKGIWYGIFAIGASMLLSIYGWVGFTGL